MHGPDGRDFPNHKRYLVVDPPNRLVFESPEVFSYVVREYHADEVLTQTLNRLGEQLAKL